MYDLVWVSLDLTILNPIHKSITIRSIRVGSKLKKKI